MISARNSNEAERYRELLSSYSLELYTFCNSPRILSSTNFPTIVFDHGVCTHHRKRHSFSKNFMQFTFFFFLHFRELVNFYLVLRYLVQNLNNQQRQIPTLKTTKQGYTVFLTNRLTRGQRVDAIPRVYNLTLTCASYQRRLFDVRSNANEEVCLRVDTRLQPVYSIIRTCFLKWAHSSGVMVSAFAMTGIMLTLSWRRCMNSTSNGFKPWPEGATK